jgi:hypothetical protein
MNNFFACLNQFNSALHMLQECTCAARIQSLSCHVELLYILHFSILWMYMRDVNEQVYGSYQIYFACCQSNRKMN